MKTKNYCYYFEDGERISSRKNWAVVISCEEARLPEEDIVKLESVKLSKAKAAEELSSYIKWIRENHRPRLEGQIIESCLMPFDNDMMSSGTAVAQGYFRFIERRGN